MPNDRASLNALGAALDGDLSPETVAAAIWYYCCARVLACTPDLPPWAHAIAAARSRAPSLIPPDAAADETARNAMLTTLRCLSKGSLNWTLGNLAGTLPAGSFADHTATLVDWVRDRRCDAWAAAALIGPSPTAAGLLEDSNKAFFAIQRWGKSAPNPTAWRHAVGKAEAQRLVRLLEREPDYLAHALPFLSDPMRFLSRLVRERQLPTALEACLDAPQQAQMDALIDAIVQRVGNPAQAFPCAILARLALRRADVGAHLVRRLTRLALRRADVGAHLVRRLTRSPNDAGAVCAAVRWEALPDAAQAVIRASADRSDVCRAILTARGERQWDGKRNFFSALAFFAALDVNVWDRLAPDERTAWLRCASGQSALRLVFRALGPRVEALRHIPTLALEDAAAGLRVYGLPPKSVRAALLPVACRGLNPSRLPALLPHLERRVGDPLVFAQVATGIALASPLDRDDDSPAPRPSLADAIDALGLLRADALHVSVLRLANSAVPLAAPARALLHAAIPPDLLAPNACASIETLDDDILLLLAATLHARRWEGDQATQSAADRTLACATLVSPAIADLLDPTVRTDVVDAETTILTRLAQTEAHIPDLRHALAILGSRAPHDTLALLMALDRLKDDPGDAPALKTLAAQQGRLRWIADLLAPDLRATIADAPEAPSAARDAARRLR